jgi:hypothetical protein
VALKDIDRERLLRRKVQTDYKRVQKKRLVPYNVNVLLAHVPRRVDCCTVHCTVSCVSCADDQHLCRRLALPFARWALRWMPLRLTCWMPSTVCSSRTILT